MLRRGFAYLAGVVAAALAGALAWLRSPRITRLTGADLLELAITVATLIRDPIEEAAAETEIGFQALRSGHLAGAEARFRRALAILAAEELPYLRATLHHHLALVLVEQNKDADEAEHHAAAALALRWDTTLSSRARIAHSWRGSGAATIEPSTSPTTACPITVAEEQTMDEFEQDIRRAIASFLADIREAAKRAALGAGATHRPATPRGIVRAASHARLRPGAGRAGANQAAVFVPLDAADVACVSPDRLSDRPPSSPHSSRQRKR